MGGLQPGLPLPIAILVLHHLIIIDLKDCFFTIPRHPEDKKHFAFSLPSVNFREPMQRFQWRVLHHDMTNSPTICQAFVSQAIMPVRQLHPQAYIIRYMDDILVSHSNKEILHQIFGELEDSLAKAGLCIPPEKVQETSPFSYTGTLITP